MTKKKRPISLITLIVSMFDKIEPLALITFVFLMIGGIQQTYSLYSIGFAYLRFFSANQLLSDSISVFLIAFSTAIVPSFIGILITTKIYKWISNKFSAIISEFASIIIVIIFIFLLRINFPQYEIAIICLLIGCMVVFVEIKNLEDERSLTSVWIKFIAISPFIIFFMVTNIRESYSNKELNIELENFSKIHSSYKAKGIESNILYFNDTFIFVELKKDSIYPENQNPKKLWKKQIRKIEILKFDKLFE